MSNKLMKRDFNQIFVNIFYPFWISSFCFALIMNIVSPKFHDAFIPAIDLLCSFFTNKSANSAPIVHITV